MHVCAAFSLYWPAKASRCPETLGVNMSAPTNPPGPVPSPARWGADMSEEFLLSPENLPAYLFERGLLKPGTEIRVRELGGGVSNIVLLIEGDGVRWVAKQSLGKLRVRADWRSNRNRISREADALEALGPELGGCRLPQVVHRDPERFFFIMTSAPEGAGMWKQKLLAGQVSLNVARRVGAALAKLGTLPPGMESLQERFDDRTVFDELRLDAYYRTTAAKHPDVRGKIERLLADSWEIRTALVHGDYSPKNVLVHETDIWLIDFEVIHRGDPTFDTGFLLNHLFLKALYQPQWAEPYFRAVREFWKSYAGERAAAVAKELEEMTIRHLGGLMLARIDGKSPAEYIRDEPARQRVRRVAKTILQEEPKTLEEIIRLVQAELRAGR